MTLEERNKLIEDNLGLVGYCLTRSKFKFRTDDEYQELRDEGLLGLIRAADLYDPSSGVKFDTYAYRCIYTGMVRWMYNVKNTNTRKANYGTESLNVLIAGTDIERINALLSDYDINQEIEMDLIFEKIRYVIKQIPNPIEQKIVLMRLGLYDGHTYTHAEISKVVNKSTRFCMVAIYKAFKRIRNHFKNEPRDAFVLEEIND